MQRTGASCFSSSARIACQPSRHSDELPVSMKGNLSYIQRTFMEEGWNPQRRGFVAKRGCNDRPVPPRPGVTLDVTLDERENAVSRLHHTAPENDEIGIEG